MYGVYIAPQPDDDFRAAVASEPKVDNGTENERDRRQSIPDRYDIRNDGNLKEYPTPKTTWKGSESRSAKSHEDENNQQQSSQHVTSEDHRARRGRLESSKITSAQSDTTVNSEQQHSDELSDPTMKRKSRNETELWIENEIIEDMRRDQELRYRKDYLNVRQFRFIGVFDKNCPN